MAARLICPPPFVNFSCTSISPATALSRIQAFLEESKTEEYLHPDCKFDDEGPHVNKAGGIILHQLRRVEKGLRGIRLQPEGEGDLKEAVNDANILLQSQADEQPLQSGDSHELRPSDDRRLDALIAARRASAPDPRDTNGKEAIDSDVDMINGEVAESYQQQLYDQEEGTIECEIGDRNPSAPTINEMTNGKPGLIVPTDSKSKKRGFEEAAGETRLDKAARKLAKKEKQRLRAQKASIPKALREA